MHCFRTNYFFVKDDAAFEEFMKQAGFTWENRLLWSTQTADGKEIPYAFGHPYMALDDFLRYNGYREDEWGDDYDAPYNLFLNELQKHIMSEDCVIIRSISARNTQPGYKMRSQFPDNISANAMIVSPREIRFVSFMDTIENTVHCMMGLEYDTIYDDG